MKYMLKLKPMAAILPWLNYKRMRGISLRHDMSDWIGGYPYDYASYDLLAQYLNCRGFELVKGQNATSLGCHEEFFRRIPSQLKE